MSFALLVLTICLAAATHTTPSPVSFKVLPSMLDALSQLHSSFIPQGEDGGRVAGIMSRVPVGGRHRRTQRRQGRRNMTMQFTNGVLKGSGQYVCC